MKLISLTLLYGVLLHLSAAGSTLVGKVMRVTGEPLAGVSVVSNLPRFGTTTDSLGRYSLTLPDAGTVTRLTFSLVGFTPRQFDLDRLPDSVILSETIVEGEGILVTSSRARAGWSATAFDNLTREEIKRDYLIEEFPLLLETTPNYFGFSYAGGGLNATEFKIRGFDAKRVSVYIDGVPLNDPEDHYTYFVDLPDYASEVSDVQVQRGVGYSQFGDASFGGSINIASTDIPVTPRVTLSSGYGGFYEGSDFVSEMRRGSVQFASGLIDGRWSVEGRYSKQYSGGYREHSWYDAFAYSLALSRIDPRMTTTIKTYGGPIRYHMAYYAISEAELATNRRINPTPYENETDNFNQPHYHLHNRYQLNDRTDLHSTFYYIRGKGHYEQFNYAGYGLNAREFNIPTSALVDSTITDLNLAYRQLVEKNQWGWSPRVDVRTRNGRWSVGGTFYLFNSDHWGEVVWAENVNATLPTQHRYYQYYGEKQLASLFYFTERELHDAIRVNGSLGAKFIRRNFSQDAVGAFRKFAFDTDWFFLSPRVGATVQASPSLSFFGSAATTAREPEDIAVYRPNDPFSFPALEITSISLSTGGDSVYAFGDPLVRSERVYNFELGGQLKRNTVTAAANLYWMEFRNEVIAEGGIDQFGNVRLGNAKRSVHAGVELSGEVRPVSQVTISGNLSWSHNRLRDHSIMRDLDFDGTPDTTIDRSGNPTAGFPEWLGNFILDYTMSPLRVVYRLRGVGRQYIENGGNRNLAIDPYFVSTLTLSNTPLHVSGQGALVVSVRLDNLFGQLYEVGGYAYDADGDGDDDGFYYVGSERSIYAQASWELW